MEALLYACVITLWVSRRLMHAFQARLRSLGRCVPAGQWAAIFAAVASTVLDVLLLPERVGREIVRCVEPMLLHKAADPNRNRPLLMRRVEQGAGA